MQATGEGVHPRRRILLGTAAATCLVLVPGLAVAARRSDPAGDTVRRLLQAASRHAFARLAAPDGFWDSSVARIGLPVLFGTRGAPMPGVLGQAKFRDELQHQLNTLAVRPAQQAASVVTRAARRMKVADGAAVLAAGPTSATSLLRQEVGAGLVNALIPALARALRSANDPTVAQALAALKGVDLGQVGHALALEADNAIWYEIGNSETEIRRNPEVGGDAALVAALKAAVATGS